MFSSGRHIMKKILLITIIFLLTPTALLSATQEQNYSPANAKVLLNGVQLVFDQEPIVFNDRILVPIRTIAESLGATVEWQDPNVNIRKGTTEIVLSVDSKTALRNRKIFFMEQPPVVINGRTMVSLRFIAEALGANVTWDENNRTVTILSDGNFTEPPEGSKGDNYYILHDPIAGPDSGPSPEEAKLYILKQGLLNDVKDIVYTPTRFVDYGSYDTMVSGNDELGQEKYIWLTKDKYTGEISVTGTALTKDGLSKETVISIMESKGINKVNIKKLYAAPYTKNQINWFVIAEQENKKYYYYLDFYTGDVVIENTTLLQGN